MRMWVHSKWCVAGSDSALVTPLGDSLELTAAATYLRQRTDFRSLISRWRCPLVNITCLLLSYRSLQLTKEKLSFL